MFHLIFEYTQESRSRICTYTHPYKYSVTPPQCQQNQTHIYSITTTAPRPFSVSTIFSPSSFGTPSFIVFGALSTNFLLSTKLNPSIDLISLMIFGFAAASNDCSFRLKSVFSCAAGAASSSSASAAAGAAAGPAENPPIGMSGMLRRDYEVYQLRVQYQYEAFR